MNCLQGISVNIDEIVKNQCEMKDLLEASGVIKDGIGANDQLFTEKYNICFPMRIKQDLNALQEMLKTNDICRRDFKASLYFLVDRQLNINKSVTNIIKKLMTRELALICTAQKKIDTKIVLKETPICNCIIGQHCPANQGLDSFSILGLDSFPILDLNSFPLLDLDSFPILGLDSFLILGLVIIAVTAQYNPRLAFHHSAYINSWKTRIQEYCGRLEESAQDTAHITCQKSKLEVEQFLENYQPRKTKDIDMEITITVTDDQKIVARPRRLPFPERKIVEEQVEQWIDDGIVEPCSSGYASQVVVVKKKDRTPRRICNALINLDSLNAISESNREENAEVDDVQNKESSEDEEDEGRRVLFRSVNATTQESIRALKLPKIELRKFGGEIKDWLPFWSSFKKIHEDTALTREDKFQYLVQSTVKDSRAFEVVNSFPFTAANYEKAIQSLESRFGKKDLLIKFYVRELLKLVLSKSKNVSLMSIYDKLETHIRALETLGVTTDMCAAMLFPLIESSLPEETLRTWQRTMTQLITHADTSVVNLTAKDRLTSLMTFLGRQVESEERIQMAKTCFADDITEVQVNKDKSKKKAKGDQGRDPDVATAAGLLSVKGTKSQQCLFCGENHDSSICERARNMNMDDKTKIIKDKQGCFKCLRTGHSYKRCRSKEKCPWCGRGHCLLMCRDLASKNEPKQTSEKNTPEQGFNEGNSCLTNVLSSAKVFLPILRVKMRGPKGIVSVRAVIDTGSHRSYVLEKVARDLGYEAAGEQTMIHLLFGGAKTKPRRHKACRIHVNDIGETYRCDFIALQQDVICQAVPRVTRGPWMDVLKEKEVHLSDTGEDKEPISLLIGADVAGKIFTDKVFQINQGITAFETKFG
ncbi:PREDICTED: uncharacterized protein LOC105449965 [Wasmannia auropunctata]|uniref:uncharacterized protein LOC105449965 n=1 Tax=Wasmannia auropunctata TaxID=64793 RepID=UPI0005EE82AB|nr:PREDICTED: uncharacterized protein LOC105449965 [Wasmannia auropunctata]